MIPAPRLVVDALKALDDARVPYVVGGSFASSAWGQPRQTMDLDLAVIMESSQIGPLAEQLQDTFMLSRDEMEEAVCGHGQFRSFQLLHFEETFKIDVFLLDRSEYAEQQIARGRPYPIAQDYVARFASPEDIVLTKLRWFELGNRVSDKQWNDIVQVLEIQKGKLDEAYLDRWSDHFGVRELLDEARSQTFD